MKNERNAACFTDAFVGRSHADSLLSKSKEGIRFEDTVSDADCRLTTPIRQT